MMLEASEVLHFPLRLTKRLKLILNFALAPLWERTLCGLNGQMNVCLVCLPSPPVKSIWASTNEYLCNTFLYFMITFQDIFLYTKYYLHYFIHLKYAFADLFIEYQPPVQSNMETTLLTVISNICRFSKLAHYRYISNIYE